MLMYPNEVLTTDAEQVACTDSDERANRSASNQQKLGPLLNVLSNKIASQLLDPRDRLNFYSSCHYMNSLGAPANHDDENRLYNLELSIVYKIDNTLLDPPQIRVSVNNRATNVLISDVIKFLNSIRDIFGNRIGCLKLDEWNNLGSDFDRNINADNHIGVQIINLWEELTVYIVTHFVPQEVEIYLCCNTIPTALDVFRDLTFTQRLIGLAIRFETTTATYNMTKSICKILVTLAKNGVRLRKLFLQDEDADDRDEDIVFAVADNIRLRFSHKMLNQTQIVEAIEAHARSLQRLDTNWLLGLGQTSFVKLLDKLEHLRALRLVLLPGIPLNLATLLNTNEQIAQQITELDLTMNTFESNNLLSSLAVRFPRVKTCRLKLYRGDPESGMDGAEIAHQNRTNYNLITDLVRSLFNENLNEWMVLTIRGIDVSNQKIIRKLAPSTRFPIASLTMGTHSWLYHMQARAEPSCNATTYNQRPNSVQIVLQ